MMNYRAACQQKNNNNGPFTTTTKRNRHQTGDPLLYHHHQNNHNDDSSNYYNDMISAMKLAQKENRVVLQHIMIDDDEYDDNDMQDRRQTSLASQSIRSRGDLSLSGSFLSVQKQEGENKNNNENAIHFSARRKSNDGLTDDDLETKRAQLEHRFILRHVDNLSLILDEDDDEIFNTPTLGNNNDDDLFLDDEDDSSDQEQRRRRRRFGQSERREQNNSGRQRKRRQTNDGDGLDALDLEQPSAQEKSGRHNSGFVVLFDEKKKKKSYIDPTNNNNHHHHDDDDDQDSTILDATTLPTLRRHPNVLLRAPSSIPWASDPHSGPGAYHINGRRVTPAANLAENYIPSTLDLSSESSHFEGNNSINALAEEDSLDEDLGLLSMGSVNLLLSPSSSSTTRRCGCCPGALWRRKRRTNNNNDNYLWSGATCFCCWQRLCFPWKRIHDNDDDDNNNNKRSNTNFLCIILGCICIGILLIVLFLALNENVSPYMAPSSPTNFTRPDDNNKSSSIKIQDWMQLMEYCDKVNGDNDDMDVPFPDLSDTVLDRMNDIRSFLDKQRAVLGLEKKVHSETNILFCSVEEMAIIAVALGEESQLSKETTEEHLLSERLERLVLASLFFGTRGPLWKNKRNWLSSKRSVCTWFGVKCGTTNGIQPEPQREIKIINLAGNSLEGTVQDDLLLLTSLKELILSSNRITWAIPSKINVLTNLERLNLWNTQIGGTVPSEISFLTNLRELRIKSNDITGTIPSELGLLHRELETLILQSAFLAGQVPSEIGQLTSLLSLGLLGNELVGEFPSEIMWLPNLKKLWLLGPGLTRNFTDDVIVFQDNLHWELIDIENTSFKGQIPSSIGRQSNLETLILSSSRISGTIPTEIGLCRQLETLSLENNAITGTLPSQLGDLRGLTRLDVSINRLEGSLPFEFSNLTNLRHLFLVGQRFSQLTGTVPESLCNFSHEEIRVSCKSSLFASCPKACCKCSSIGE